MLRRRRRRNRRLAVIGVLGAVLVVIAVAVGRPGLGGGGGDAPSSVAADSTATAQPVTTASGAQATTGVAARTASTPAKAAATPARATTTSTSTAASAPKTSTTKTTAAPASARPAVPTLADLPIEQDPIPYGAGRRAEMAGYSKRHYGIDSSKLDPKLIVLHYTSGDSYQSAWSTFAADTPAAGPAGSAAELPGTCSQFIVDQQGTIHQLVPLTLQCRHTIGLNRWAIGIEMVQSDAGHDSIWATDQILHRPKQITAVLALVRALMARYDLSKSDVIGHGTANDDPRFVDLEGWRNDHTDWLAPAVKELRSRL